ncbi:spermidine/putrescine-binding periplasmic protein [Salmonella sp. NCTC 11881]|nr:spermidine/putrescine-binding periplasmic protein [Salmonella sp. NCTC 11881]
MALRKLGYSGNTTDPKEIEAAYEELKKTDAERSGLQLR